MPSSVFRWLLPAACALTALATPAQSADPLDASAPVSPLVHRSTFDAYRSLAGPAPLGWREANETVGSVGGWRAYAREASAAQVAPDAATEASTPASSAAPLPGRPAPAPTRPTGHGGHSKH